MNSWRKNCHNDNNTAKVALYFYNGTYLVSVYLSCWANTKRDLASLSPVYRTDDALLSAKLLLYYYLQFLFECPTFQVQVYRILERISAVTKPYVLLAITINVKAHQPQSHPLEILREGTSHYLCWQSNISTSFAIKHTHPFNGPFSGTTRVRRYQKGFYWSKRQWVPAASAGPYASLHLAPDR